MKKRYYSPGLVLLFTAPVLGELVSGHQTLFQFINPIFFAVTALPYGFGALLCRELARRWHKGWLSLLLLSAAYGLYEEGIVSRALFNPQWSELGALAHYNHYAGINWTYSILLIHFHITISILAGIMLVELLYPVRRHNSWLTNWQLALCGLGLVLWAPVLAFLASYDEPLFVPPAGLWALTVVAILGLVAAARWVPAQPLKPSGRPAPRPRRFTILGVVNMTVVFVTVFILPENSHLLPPLLVSVIFLVTFDVLSFWLFLRWSGNMFAWNDQYQLALVTGLLLMFLGYGVLSDLDHFEAKTLVSAVSLWALWKIGQRVDRRTLPPAPTPPPDSTPRLEAA